MFLVELFYYFVTYNDLSPMGPLLMTIAFLFSSDINILNFPHSFWRASVSLHKSLSLFPTITDVCTMQYVYCLPSQNHDIHWNGGIGPMISSIIKLKSKRLQYLCQTPFSISSSSGSPSLDFFILPLL